MCIYICVRPRAHKRASLKRVLGARYTDRITNRSLLMASKNKSRVQRARPEGRLFACPARAYTESPLPCVRVTSAQSVETVLLATTWAREETVSCRYSRMEERKRYTHACGIFVPLKSWNDIAYFRLKVNRYLPRNDRVIPFISHH